MDGNGEEVSEFLLRIRELSDKQDKEDDERARKLEAEILAGREARRARRDGMCLGVVLSHCLSLWTVPQAFFPLDR
jgi:hypothetical protein